MSEFYESKDYVVIDEDRYLVGESVLQAFLFDTREEAAKFIDEMQELGRQNLVILGPEDGTPKHSGRFPWEPVKDPEEFMKKLSDAIVDMVMDGADAEEIRKLIEFSKDAIDAEKAERQKKGADLM